MEILTAIAVAVGAVAGLLILLSLRRRMLLRAPGAIDMSLRTRFGRMGGGWALGVGRYASDDMAWNRVFALIPIPSRILSWRELKVIVNSRPTSIVSWELHVCTR